MAQTSLLKLDRPGVGTSPYLPHAMASLSQHRGCGCGSRTRLVRVQQGRSCKHGASGMFLTWEVPHTDLGNIPDININILLPSKASKGALQMIQKC